LTRYAVNIDNRFSIEQRLWSPKRKVALTERLDVFPSALFEHHFDPATGIAQHATKVLVVEDRGAIDADHTNRRVRSTACGRTVRSFDDDKVISEHQPVERLWR
jgi:hypothetical protein